jgi:hypothetical protein
MSQIQKNFAKALEKAVGKGLRGSSWTVFRHYELGNADDFTFIHAPLLRPAQSEDDPDRISVGDKRRAHNKAEDVYRPLVDMPALFLEFARLLEDPGLDAPEEGGWHYGELETKKNIEVTLDWARTYGVLGLSPTSPGHTLDEARDLHKEVTERNQPDSSQFGLLGWPVPSGESHRWPPERLERIRGILDAGQPGPPAWREVSVHGGLKDTVTRFVIEAMAANSILRLYEAATATKRPKLDIIRSYMPEDLREALEPPRWYREWALTKIWATVDHMVRDHCHPMSYRRGDGAFMMGWGFRSLLGAMWLQMLWLLTAPEEDVRRCRWCDRVIDFEQPEQPTTGARKVNRPGKRKIRKDKQFCDDRHKAAFDYYVRIKPGLR